MCARSSLVFKETSFSFIQQIFVYSDSLVRRMAGRYHSLSVYILTHDSGSSNLFKTRQAENNLCVILTV